MKELSFPDLSDSFRLRRGRRRGCELSVLRVLGSKAQAIA